MLSLVFIGFAAVEEKEAWATAGQKLTFWKFLVAMY
jgi:hypothetical protein